jgi:hypothetical protein
MRGKSLLSCCAFVVFTAVAIPDSLAAQGTPGVVNVNVRVDCLAGRGVSFSLIPWVIEVQPGDSINWLLDPTSNVTDMDVINKMPGNQWPFQRKPPYRSTKQNAAGARARDNAQSGRRYKYAVSAICPRNAAEADTVIIDPDMIIIR